MSTVCCWASKCNCKDVKKKELVCVIMTRQMTAEIKALNLKFFHNCYHAMKIKVNTISCADDTWVHHYESEIKYWTLEYYHKASSVINLFRTQALARNLMVTGFGNADSVIHMDFLELCITICSKYNNCNIQNDV